MKRNEGSNLTGRKIKDGRLGGGKSRDFFVKLCSEYGLKISENDLQNIEENKRVVYDFELVVFAKVLNISIDDFFAL